MHYFTIAGLIGGQELIIIAIIVLLLFGGRKIPELMKGLGQGVRNFKEGKDGVDEVRNDGYQRPYDNVNSSGQYNTNNDYRNTAGPGYDNRPDPRYNTNQPPYNPPADGYNQNPPRG